MTANDVRNAIGKLAALPCVSSATFHEVTAAAVTRVGSEMTWVKTATGKVATCSEETSLPDCNYTSGSVRICAKFPVSIEKIRSQVGARSLFSSTTSVHVDVRGALINFESYDDAVTVIDTLVAAIEGQQ